MSDTKPNPLDQSVSLLVDFFTGIDPSDGWDLPAELVEQVEAMGVTFKTLHDPLAEYLTGPDGTEVAVGWDENGDGPTVWR